MSPQLIQSCGGHGQSTIPLLREILVRSACGNHTVSRDQSRATIEAYCDSIQKRQPAPSSHCWACVQDVHAEWLTYCGREIQPSFVNFVTPEAYQVGHTFPFVLRRENSENSRTCTCGVDNLFFTFPRVLWWTAISSCGLAECGILFGRPRLRDEINTQAKTRFSLAQNSASHILDSFHTPPLFSQGRDRTRADDDSCRRQEKYQDDEEYTPWL